MRFSISVHARHGAPEDAIERLAGQLGSARQDARFSLRRREIVATWGEDAPAAMERDEREESGRRALLAIVSEVCERTPDLEFGWYAISPLRY